MKLLDFGLLDLLEDKIKTAQTDEILNSVFWTLNNLIVDNTIVA